MKETNMEHFRGEIEKVLESSDELPCLIDGKLQVCKGNMDCHKCEFSGRGDCGLSFVKWAMSEYKPEPVLTEREKHFVELIGDGYIARDENPYRLYWYPSKPYKINYQWTFEFLKREQILIPNIFNSNAFPFITWEDEEPWSVESLRKLKVEDA